MVNKLHEVSTLRNDTNLETARSQLAVQERQEQRAKSCLVMETLKALKLTPENLPRHCQDLLKKSATFQNDLHVPLDQISISLQQTKATTAELEQKYELLELKQENKRLQNEINNNKKFLEGLRRDLEESKWALESQNQNPGNVNDFLKQTKQKLNSYEKIYEKSEAKFHKLQAPGAIHPGALTELAAQLDTMREEESELKQRADDILLAREALLSLHRC